MLLRIARAEYLKAVGAGSQKRFSEAGRNLYEEIFTAYQQEKLVLPVLREHVMKIRTAINNPRSDVDTIANMVMNEPVVAAKLVQVSNSVLFPGMKQLTTVRDAITRIGLSMTNEIVLAQSLKGMFYAKSPHINRRLRTTYRHSTLIASLAFGVVRQKTNLNKDHALLAGLLHDLGVIPILTYMDQKNLLDEVQEDEMEHIISKLRGLVGGMVLSQLGFDEWLIMVAEEAEVWDRDIPGPADYADAVIIAHLHSFLGTPEMNQHPRVDEVGSFARLGLKEFDPVSGLKLLKDAESATSAIMQALS